VQEKKHKHKEKNMRTFLVVLAVLFLLVGVVWLAGGLDLAYHAFFAPKYAAVDRDIYTHTPSYQQGMVQELSQLQIEYIKATNNDTKMALRSKLLHDYNAYRASCSENTLPDDLTSFCERLRKEAASGN
jgi:hypothetical protein